MDLGKLSYIDDIRKILPNEAKDFTPWLAGDIKLLGDELGYDFEVITSERMLVKYQIQFTAFKFV